MAMKGVDQKNGVDAPCHVDINKSFVCLPGRSFGMQGVGFWDLFLCTNRRRNINTD